MSGRRSNFPQRIQQIASSGRQVPPSIILESEPPPKVKEFIDRVIKSPLHDIAIPLSGFRWEYNKGNFHHWRPLFLHFDTYFRTNLSIRKDLLLSDDVLEENIFPKHSVLQILRVMQTILENCHNKNSFSGLEHFKLLLASTDPEILIASLETLSALVKVHPSKLHVSGKLIGCGSINSFLLSLAQGWGSKEEGLGLLSCVMENERILHEGLRLFPSDNENNFDGTQYQLGSTLHFEFNRSASQGSEQSSLKRNSNVCAIHIPDLHLRKEDDLMILKQCIEQFSVPSQHRFSLLTRIRYAHSLRSSRICRLYCRICILAFIVLVQSDDAKDELVSFFANEPEYANELIRLVQYDDSVPAIVRALSMQALGAQLAAYASSPDHARVLSGSSIISVGGNRMVLLSVLQKAVLSLSNSTDPSSSLFVDALLQFFLLHVLSSSSSGSSIRGSGMIAPLLPLLEDNDPAHTHLVCSAVKTLQKLMEYSSPAVSLFKDLGGVELLAQRLQIEVQRVIGTTSGNSNTIMVGDSLKSEEDYLYSQKQLIKALLKALGSATYSPANSTRSQANDNSLLVSLAAIFHNVNIFGGEIYFSAVTLMSEVIHKDPTCFLVLDELGLPSAFISSVISGILPSCKALICVPNGLGAVCLNAKGLEAVKENAALKFLIDTFTTRKYLVAMNEGVVLLANAMEELLRHVSSLRSAGVDVIVEIISRLVSLGEDKFDEFSAKMNGDTSMETDIEDKENEGHDLVSAMEFTADGIADEQFLQLCIFHTMVLVHRTMENSETCRLFVERGGLSSLMKLLLRPSITQSSEGMPIALHSTLVFKGFTQHHSAPLASAFTSSLRDYLEEALNRFSSVSGSFILGAGTVADNGIFSSLSVIEFLLLLASSKDNRWMNALFTEFGYGSRDVLENIGRVHREVLWQIALLEDLKIEPDVATPLTNEEHRSNLTVGESEEHRYSSSSHFSDSLTRQRGSGWSFESRLSDLISTYRDLGRPAGRLRRLGIDGSSTRQHTSSSQLWLSNSADASSVSKIEADKQSSHCSSHRDMMRSLSYHISHLFMEFGKAMLLSSRRENNHLNLPSSVTSVASAIASIALDHLNFSGHSNPPSEKEVSTKCRYLGKVVDFIDEILLDRPESCNPIMVNCFYNQGVIQASLATFEATSQLLFAVKGVPASPMEMDNTSFKQVLMKETDDTWIYGPLASYCALMDHLATSSFIFTSSTKQFLEYQLTSGTFQTPRDAEVFVKMLQSKVLKAVLPIWTHPHFAECDLEFITGMIKIMRHAYSGVEIRVTSGSSRAQPIGPLLDESAISVIVEMGFSRSRAEEALRQVGTNRVEIATEWLFLHPEEPQEDDELAQALAMSLGSSDASLNEARSTNSNNPCDEEEPVQLPPVDEMLLACLRLLQAKESLAYPVRDLFVMISSQNGGHYRSKVLTFIIDNVKQCCMASDRLSNSLLSPLFHVIALILHEDVMAREVMMKAGLVKIASDLLYEWNLNMCDSDKLQVPKWVTTCFLSIDRMLQVDPKLSPDITEQLRMDDLVNQTSVIIDENRRKDIQSDMHEQKKLLELCNRCICNQFPSETMHAVLQLCATLTKVHTVAVSFLEAGGLHALLSLPTHSLFPGYSTVAAAIIRHILEDPHTLQQVMELEIRHSLITVTSRHSNARATPRNFVQNLASVISRDPGVFLRAARAVCQIEMVGDRPYIVLLKDHEKEKTKEKEKEKATEKEQPAIDVKNPGGNAFMNPDNGHKLADSNVKTIKNHRKAPQCFSTVIDHLLDSIVAFVPLLESDSLIDDPVHNPSLVHMDIDSTSAKGKGKAVSLPPEDSKIANLEASASLAKAVFVMKLLTDILLTYTSSIYVLLRRDVEISSSRGSSLANAGIFYHVLHKFLPYPGIDKKKKVEGDWRCKLASRAKQFLVASSIRSTEGRRRVFSEINNVFNEFFEKSNGCKAPDTKMHTFVDLLNDILAARSPTGSHISGEASATFIDVGLVCSLTRALQVLDLDDTDSPKIVTGIIKALEIVSKEYVHSADQISKEGGNSLNPSSNQNQVNSSYSDGDRFQSIETTSIGVAVDHIDPFNSIQTSGGSLDSVADDMDHDRDTDGGFPREVEGDTMHGTFEDGGGLGNGMATVEIRFDVRRHDADDGEGGGGEEEGEEEEEDDDDDDMSADEVDVDDDDEDEDENNDLEDEDQQMMHPETDQDDHEMDGEEFDDDMLEEDDEDDDDDDDDEENGRFTLEFETDNTGSNVFDHIEVLSADIPGNALPVMPLDMLDSRRSSRTTSIYNLLGRAGDRGFQFDHPLLEEPSVTQIVHNRQSGNVVDTAFSDRNHESISQTDALYRTMRGGRQSHRFNMWLDDNLQRDRSNISSVLPGIEELLVSQLRQPILEQPSEQDALKAHPIEKDEPNQVQISEAEAGEEILDINAIAESMTSPLSRSVTNGSANADIGPSNEDLFQERGAANTSEQVIAMQYESSGVALPDVEAVNQASSGSEAALGGSLHSSEVEIGRANGHDEGERQGPPDSALNDLQVTALARRSSGGIMPVSGRDAGLESVSEVPQNSSEETDQNGLHEENQLSRNLDSDSIDPAFLEALPEELRAEVLASQQTQVAQPSGEQSQADGDIDPEFLAALPPDIREEVLAQQRAQRRRQSQELDGQPVEMDPVSLIATFPSDLREDVLLTSPENLLASLTPALVAEANILRERFARYSGGPIFRRQSHRSESSRRFDILGSSLDRNAGDVASRRSVGMLVEANGSPLVDTDALKSIIRLLRIVQPVYKGQLQRLLLNLCAHRETRKSLVEILMDILILDLRGPINSFVGAVEPPFRLYACRSNIIYSRPQFSEGVPPLVSRRILETLTYLAQSNQNIAKLLLQLKLPDTSMSNDESSSKGRGKSVIVMEEDKLEDKKGYHSIDLLLRLLNQPLYMRSAAHLEQLLNVLEVILFHAESDSTLSIKSGASVEQPSGSEATMQGTQINTNTVEVSAGKDGKFLQVDDGSGSSISAEKRECSDHIVLLSLPHAELRLLCSLLAREGLSDNVYVLVAEVMKKLVTLAPTYCYLFITEIANSMYNLTMSAVSELHLHEDAEKALLITSSTNGITILRVLQALSSLVAALHEKNNPHLFSEKDYSDALSKISDINVGLESLWQQLSNCISKIEISSEPTSDLAAMSSNLSSTSSRVIPPLPAGTQNILPYIESFFVTCEKLYRGQPDAVQDFGATASDIDDVTTSSGGPKSSPFNAKIDEKNIAFVKFSERHKKLLNAFIRQNPGLLERSFSLMLKVPRVIDFDNKRSHFRSKMKHQHDHHHSPVRVSVRRAYILEDSYNKLRMRSPQDLKGRLIVHFQGEEGIDAGGLTREWYQLLSRVIFDKNTLLFTTVGSDSTFQPNPNSVYQTEHLSYFKFVGRVVGKALFDGQLLDVYFTRSFYKHILGVKVTYHDIEAIDPGYYKNLKWMLENDITEVLDLTFSLDADEEKLILYERAEVTDSELVPDGRNIRVTEENKHEYVDRVVEHRLTTAIRPQINAFMEGINELIPRDLISIFNDKELELLISGLPDIDLEDLRANTDYTGYSNGSPVIHWLWEVVQGFSKEDKARFLQFVTGTSKVPLEGFSALQGISGSQRFQIHKAYASPDHLPSAHTCFNQLDLPEYTSREQLQERLLLAIHEGSEGFGFG